MLKWIYRFDFETIPTNPYTNLRFDKIERYCCYSVALNYYNNALTLPLYYSLKMSEIKYIIKKLCLFFKKNK